RLIIGTVPGKRRHTRLTRSKTVLDRKSSSNQALKGVNGRAGPSVMLLRLVLVLLVCGNQKNSKWSLPARNSGSRSNTSSKGIGLASGDFSARSDGVVGVVEPEEREMVIARPQLREPLQHLVHGHRLLPGGQQESGLHREGQRGHPAERPQPHARCVEQFGVG